MTSLLPDIICAATWAVQFQHLDGGVPQTLSNFAMDVRVGRAVESTVVVQFAASGKPGTLTFDSATKTLTATLSSTVTDGLRPFAEPMLYWDLFANVGTGGSTPRRRIAAGEVRVAANVTASS